MSWKDIAQTSLSDALAKRHAALEGLDGIHQLVDWREMEKRLPGVHAKKQGEQAWPALLMFKALLLQSWYGLGGPGLEKQLGRGLMSRRFINLGLSEGASDHSTAWGFQNTLAKQGLLGTILSEGNRQLSAKGLYIKAGEASNRRCHRHLCPRGIEAKQSRPRLCPLGARVKTGRTPRTAGPGTASKSPPTARKPALTGIRRMSMSIPKGHK